MAGFLLVGVLVASGHHFFIVASAKAHAVYAAQNHEQRHQHEPDHSTTAVEAHTIAAVIQKYQASKFLEITAFLSRPLQGMDILPYKEVAFLHPTVDEPPPLLPLDLKTTFLT